MSKRPFDSDFWIGKYVISLPFREKAVYCYLVNYPQGNIAGIYDDQPDTYAFHLKLPVTEIEESLKRLEDDKKIARIDGLLVLLKWCKHQAKNPDVVKGIIRELASLPTETLQRVSQSGYTLPTGCTWKQVFDACESKEQDEKIQAVLSVDTPSTQPGLPYPTLPNSTLPNPTLPAAAQPGDGEGKKIEGENQTDPWYDSRENVLGLTEFEVMSLDRPEYNIPGREVYLYDEYRFLCSEVASGKLEGIKNPLKFLESRLAKRVLLSKKM